MLKTPEETRAGDLITRLEQATEGSEKLDVAIGREWYGYGPDDPLWHMMPFSRSLDAALTLVPGGWRVYAIQQEYLSANSLWFAGLDQLPPVRYQSVLAKAPTPALALCVAALRARKADKPKTYTYPPAAGYDI